MLEVSIMCPDFGSVCSIISIVSALHCPSHVLGEELETKLKESESQLEESQAMVKMLSIPPPDVPGADRHELLRLLDRRQHEIDQLSEEWKVQSAKLASVALEKSEFQTRFSI